jgi:hypothetical protein
LNRETSQGPHWNCLEPLFSVLHSHPDHIWEKDTLQRRSTVLGPVAWWLLLDPVHDHRGLPGILHPSDNHQVSNQQAGSTWELSCFVNCCSPLLEVTPCS